MLANFLAVSHVLVRKFLGCGQGQRLLFLNTLAGAHRCADPFMALTGSTAVGRAAFSV